MNNNNSTSKPNKLTPEKIDKLKKIDHKKQKSATDNKEILKK